MVTLDLLLELDREGADTLGWGADCFDETPEDLVLGLEVTTDRLLRLSSGGPGACRGGLGTTCDGRLNVCLGAVGVTRDGRFGVCSGEFSRL